MADHAWCNDTARDAAVRAAEDGRTRPLPTLGEAIVLAFGFDKASAQRACDEVNSWPDDVQKHCRFVLGNLLEQGVERLQALVEAWRWGKGLLAARYPAMIPKSVSTSSAPEHENKGDGMATKSEMQAADYRAEAQAAPFAVAAERSVPVSKTGEGQSGLRTERVTLEITHKSPTSAAEFLPRRLWWDRSGESVRVVEEAPSDADAEVLRRALVKSEIQRLKAESEAERLRKELQAASGNRPETPEGSTQAASGGGEQLREQVAAIVHEAMRFYRVAETATWQGGNSLAEDRARQAATEIAALFQAASGGGEGEPVAWGVRMKSGTFKGFLFPSREQANKCAELITDDVVAFFEEPPQPRGWLTEEEREIIAGIADDDEYTEEGQNIAKALLARSSPPEVVLESWREAAGEVVSLDDVRAALAAAGVAVKEVGRE
jgi:hypothetical protein